MSDRHPWLMAIQADTAIAAERQRLAQALEARVQGNPEWILLNTCHRVELYGFGGRPDLGDPLHVETGENAVRHLIRVATGLESAIVGEDEVLHQVREALRQARSSRGLDHRLIRLFETAIAAGRRARAGRTASGGNLAQKAMGWLRQRSTIAGRTVLIAGAGRMGSALAHSARLAGANVTIASRDTERARRLAQVYGGDGIDLAGGAQAARSSAGIAVALGGVWNELGVHEGTLPPIADISAPQAVPASVRARSNGDFLGIDDLYVRVRPVPGAYSDEADRVVASKTLEYVRWLEAR